MAAVCGIPTADQERKKNLPNGETGEGELTRRKHPFSLGSIPPGVRLSVEGGELRPVLRHEQSITTSSTKPYYNKLDKGGHFAPGNSRNSFQKRFARGSDHFTNRSDPRASRI